MGRFITPDTYIQDPADPQTFNRYSYVQNNPVNLVDPTGNFSWGKLFFIAAVAFIGAFTGGLAYAALIANGYGFVAASVIAGAIGGAVSGAISGGVQGGFKGALKGAALGAATGAALGLGGAVFGRGFAIAALVAGGAYAYKKEGWDGIAYFAAGVTGGAAGFASGASTGQDIFGVQPVPTSQGSPKESARTPSLKEQHQNKLASNGLAERQSGVGEQMQARIKDDSTLNNNTLDPFHDIPEEAMTADMKTIRAINRAATGPSEAYEFPTEKVIKAGTFFLGPQKVTKPVKIIFGVLKEITTEAVFPKESVE